MNHDDHAKKHGRYAVNMAWSWPCFAMIMARSCHGSHVFPTRVVTVKKKQGCTYVVGVTVELIIVRLGISAETTKICCLQTEILLPPKIKSAFFCFLEISSEIYWIFWFQSKKKSTNQEPFRLFSSSFFCVRHNFQSHFHFMNRRDFFLF